MTSGYPKVGSIPSGSPWCEYRVGLGDATDLHNGLHGADFSAADPRLRPLRVGAGRMMLDVAAPARCACRRRVWMSVGYERTTLSVDFDHMMRSVVNRAGEGLAEGVSSKSGPDHPHDPSMFLSWTDDAAGARGYAFDSRPTKEERLMMDMLR